VSSVRLPPGEETGRRMLNAALRGTERAAALTQRLLAFSRRQALQPRPVDLNKLVAGMSELVRRTLGEAAVIETVLAGGLWPTLADPNQLENALLNLAVNARDAMPEGGKLTIETANAHLDEAYAARNSEVESGQYVMLAVTDTGTGMSRETMEKAFEPFYTTKAVGEGSGLGLSQVYGFVKQSRGHAKIYSELGQGTTVKIYLPRHLAPVAEVTAADTPSAVPTPGGGQVVLVVEDDDDVREFTVAALDQLGYRVLEARDAAAALRHLESRSDVALLFTDVVLPEMNGRLLADEARRRRPDLKVLFTTGYTRNAIVHNGSLDPDVDMIGKPFTLQRLAAKLREVMKGSG
jgi:CheY-like chemotaxis protein